MARFSELPLVRVRVMGRGMVRVRVGGALVRAALVHEGEGERRIVGELHELDLLRLRLGLGLGVRVRVGVGVGVRVGVRELH